MELDDFRRGWKQPTATEAPVGLDTATLAKMLARASKNPMAKMRRNVWIEIGTVVVCLAGCTGAATTSRDPYYLAMAAWLALICLLSGFYFRRKLTLLRGIGDASGGAVREYVGHQLHQLRSLMKLYYRATMWSVPMSFGITLLFLGGRITQQVAGQKLLFGLGVLGFVVGLLAALTYFGMSRFTKWWLQRLYGQHLDRLETVLHDLEK
ncbi:hypothetical protein MTX78_05370 [Hymenobacter tibetensis]|uniref:RDD domain-containing protein n=1 Tax=Hymenobacter tibetensis TaxID=497967 RepID=A0ABY4D0K2_9BACT|nr:hypothetical protein [Hymenobacter tibetensis]UOG76030.1 hypothetical protein MTX78_05370 [Hymenobacter tibetensis]